MLSISMPMGMTIVSLSSVIWMGESEIVARMEQILFNASPEDSTTSWISNDRKAANDDICQRQHVRLSNEQGT